MKQQITVAIVGLGNRGKDTYAKCALEFPELMKLCAIADIVPEKVSEVASCYNIPKERCFSSAEELLQQEQLADVLFICTQDRQHYAHAIAALERGYDLLLEKPMSPSAEECRRIAETAERLNRKVAVCHVLRYTPFYRKLKSLLDERVIGELISIQAIENVGYFHQAHSFVRGNWNNSDHTSPMILQKCCHDMDILLWLADKNCKAVSSFGSLRYFKESHAPSGSTKRCTDCAAAVKAACPYDAEKIYLTNPDTGILHGHLWPCNVLTLRPTEETVRQAIQEGPYGRCVFHCDNNVVDHQVVNLWLEDEVTVSFTMCAFTKKVSRQLKLMGTHGEIEANMERNEIHIHPFDGEDSVIDVTTLATDFSGHAGGDNRLVKDFLTLVADGTPGEMQTSPARSVQSHRVALAAETSRIQNGTVIPL